METGGLRGKIIYWRCNREIRVDSDEAQRLIRLTLEGEPIATFESEHNVYGYFVNEVYTVTGGLIVRSVWHPNPGYSWSEEIYTFIPIPPR